MACKKDDDDQDMECQSIELQALNIVDAPCGSATGSIEIMTNADLEYSIDEVNFSSTGLFENLVPGIYNITAKDLDNCETSKEFKVISGASLMTDVSPIIEATCAIANCHISGGQSPDFTVKANIIMEAARIRSNVSSQTMPPENTAGPALSAQAVETLLCWIDDGALDN